MWISQLLNISFPKIFCKFLQWCIGQSMSFTVWENCRSRNVTRSSSTHYLLFSEIGHKIPMLKVPYLYQEEGRHFLSPEMHNLGLRNLYKQNLLKTNLYLPSFFFTIYYLNPNPSVLSILYKFILSLSKRNSIFLL